MKFSNNREFTDLLRRKEDDIKQRTSDGIQDTVNFQKLRSHLSKAREKHIVNNLHLIIIDRNSLDSLAEEIGLCVDRLFENKDFITNRTVCVDSDLNIEHVDNTLFPEGNNDARRYFAELTKENSNICFLISPDGATNYFIDGKDYGDGVFYSDRERNKYEELKPIEQLEEVLGSYRKELERQYVYEKFFVQRSQLRSMWNQDHHGLEFSDYQEEFKHILKNKPEASLRDDMMNYLKKHMRVSICRELMMDDLDRLDIQLVDEMGTDLYFIEIKWVGSSINLDGNAVGTTYRAKTRINPDAVDQVLSYIGELFSEDKPLKIGYLAVFDARKNDEADTGSDITIESVKEEYQRYFPYYKKLDDFRIININPR